MNVFIVDDEISNREIVEIMVNTYFPEFSLIGQAENVTSALEKIETLHIDLLFLDVLMPNQTGFDLLNQLKEKDFEIIFISGFDNYAIKAFSYSAIDYILKPIDKDQFIKAVNRAIERKNERNRLRELDAKINQISSITLSIPYNNKTLFISADNIAYLKGMSGGYTEINCIDGEKYTVSKSLKQLEAELEGDDRFINVSKSITINVNDVASCDKGATGYVALKTDNFELFLPRRKKREVLQAIENKLVKK